MWPAYVLCGGPVWKMMQLPLLNREGKAHRPSDETAFSVSFSHSFTTKMLQEQGPALTTTYITAMHQGFAGISCGFTSCNYKHQDEQPFPRLKIYKLIYKSLLFWRFFSATFYYLWLAIFYYNIWIYNYINKIIIQAVTIYDFTSIPVYRHL